MGMNFFLSSLTRGKGEGGGGGGGGEGLRRLQTPAPILGSQGKDFIS